MLVALNVNVRINVHVFVSELFNFVVGLGLIVYFRLACLYKYIKHITYEFNIKQSINNQS